MPLSQKIYLDYAATTPVDAAVLRAMMSYFSENFGNAGSLHSFGQEAMAALDMARETIANSIGAGFREVLFTASATEANNLVLRGIVKIVQERKTGKKKPKIIISAIEHESILKTAQTLEYSGDAEVVYLPVNSHGIINPEELKEEINKETVLVSIMYANNEIGTIQPLPRIRKIIDDFKKKNLNNKTNYPFFHTDAAQAFQFLDCDIRELDVDLMTLSSHKIYGPKGAGALYVRDLGAGSQILESIITGGGQELGLRAGTENIPSIVGFAKAVETLVHLRRSANEKIAELREELWRGIKKICPSAKTNGIPLDETINRLIEPTLPNILNIYFPNYDAADLLTEFDLRGLAVSSGSACRARASTPSYVIERLGYSRLRARSSLRFSLGRPTTKKEIVETLRIIKETVQQ